MKSSAKYKLFTLFVCALFFLVSTGINIDLHYCRGELKTYSFLGKAKSCHQLGDDGEGRTCPYHENKSKEDQTDDSDENNCCENKSHFIHFDVDKQLQILELDNQVYFISQLSQVFLPEINWNRDTPYIDLKKPPPILEDILILNQTFLL